MPINTALPQPDTACVNVEFAVGDDRWNAGFVVPSSPCRLIDLLPSLHSFTDAIVDVAANSAARQGHPISCRKGCGACCRQLVPISRVEAEALRELVESMPEPRRTAVRARFDDATNRLEEAGLLPALQRLDTASRASLQPLGLDYFRLGIPCPFLEDESCSIHADRPLACREYLVTSSPDHCASPSAETVRCVPLAASVSKAVARVGVEPNGCLAHWTFLTLAFDDSAMERPDAPRPGQELLHEVFLNMTKKGDSHD